MPPVMGCVLPEASWIRVGVEWSGQFCCCDIVVDDPVSGYVLLYGTFTDPLTAL